MGITKNQVRLYRILKNNFVQLALYSVGVFLFIFIALVYQYSLQVWEELPDTSALQSAIDSLPTGKDLRNKRTESAAKIADFEQAIQDLQVRDIAWKTPSHFQDLSNIFLGAFIYFLIIGIPVFFVYFFIYKRRLDRLLHYFVTDAQIRGWVFPLFLITSSLISFIFTLLLSYIPLIVKQNWYLLLVSSHNYINFVTIEFVCLLTVGAAFTKEAIEKNREHERTKRLTDIRRRRTVEDALALIRVRIRPHFLFRKNIVAIHPKRQQTLRRRLCDVYLWRHQEDI